MKCKTRTEFHNRFRKAYILSKNNGWYDEVTKHMEKHVHPQKYTLEEAKEIAKKYKTLHEFIANESSLYGWCVRQKKLEDVTCELEKNGNFNKRCIYGYFFPGNVCYIGLTYNINERHKQHVSGKRFSSVLEYSNRENAEIPYPIQLTDYLDIKESKIKEREFIKKYKDLGYTLLNRVDGGSTGGNLEKYTIDDCINEAKDCLTRKEFELKNKYLYMKVKKHKWDDVVFAHMDEDVSKKIRSEKIKLAKTGSKMNIKNIDDYRRKHSHFCVEKYSLTGEKIGEYKSAYEAAREVSGSPTAIYSCCNGKTKTAFGYVWKYKYEKKEWKYVKKKENKGSSKSIDKYSMNDEYLETYKSIKDAAEKIGHKSCTVLIRQCCDGDRKSTCGFKWRYHEANKRQDV